MKYQHHDEISKVNRRDLLTERSNLKSKHLDTFTTNQLVNLFSEEDLEPQRAVSKCIPEITESIDCIFERLKNGGRLFYIGAGTSGRLGVLDSSECPPTFCTPPDLVQGIIAGGDASLKSSSEHLEDSPDLSINDLQQCDFSVKDCLVGITAGGTTTYVNTALAYARKLGALTVSISCVPKEQVFLISDVDIRLLTGPEILTGSTRLKAGTATKMLLNMISTIVMIKLGKVYGNKMVDLSVSNKKLNDRALRILSDVADVEVEEGRRLLEMSNGSVKDSLLMAIASIDLNTARLLLEENGQNLREAIRQAANINNNP